ncbi:MAG TPA: S8 family serine peptidase [Pseudobdellovibrionaceae bacterium]|nr:S8 family serine peptidase [Pseudobdellovibrionaceae bacterium]
MNKKYIFLKVILFVFVAALYERPASATVAVEQLAVAHSVFQNLDEYKEKLGFEKYYSKEIKKNIKVAIIDQSFYGYEAEIGKTLPNNTLMLSEDSVQNKNSRGLRVAQLFTAMATNNLNLKSVNMELYLYTVLDDQTFKWVVQDLAYRKVDLVLYTQEIQLTERSALEWVDYSLDHGAFWIISSGESLFSPANHPEVLTVGAVDSKKSFAVPHMRKPNILAPSLVQDSEESYTKGSSNAAALVAAGVALVQSTQPELNRDQIRSNIIIKYDWSLRGLGLQLLRFTPTGPNCFWTRGVDVTLPNYIQRFRDEGAQWVETSAGLRFMVPFDPLYLVPEGKRLYMDDMITLGANGFKIYRRFSRVPYGEVEVFQTPLEVGLCQWPGLYKSKFFKL